MMAYNVVTRTMRTKLFFFLTIFAALLSFTKVDAFLSPISRSSQSPTALFGAFNKRNKQADLMKKMQAAKKQKELLNADVNAVSNVADEKIRKRSDEEIKKENDMKRFEQLLNSEAATINYGIDGNSNNYMTKKQEEEEITAVYQGVERIFEGDPAPEEPFQDLVRVESGNALGEAGAKILLPWLNSNSAKQTDYLVILSDPRPKSSEMRSAMRSLVKLPPNILKQTVVINADTPAENRRYLKKQGITSMKVLCDEKREWMREYTALGEKRWAICMFIVADKRVQKVAREVDADSISNVVQNAVKSLSR